MCVWWRLVLRRRERRRRRRRIESCCMDILVVRVFSFHAVVMPPWSSSSSSSSCEANGSLRLSSIHYKVMSSLFRHGLSLSLLWASAYSKGLHYRRTVDDTIHTYTLLLLLLLPLRCIIILPHATNTHRRTPISITKPERKSFSCILFVNKEKREGKEDTHKRREEKKRRERRPENAVQHCPYFSQVGKRARERERERRATTT